MKKSTLGVITVVALLAPLSANAVVVFEDTFDTVLQTEQWDDPSIDLAIRQTGGTTNSTYTLSMTTNNTFRLGPVLAGVGLNQPALLRRTPAGSGDTILNLDTDFGSSLAGKPWSLSYDGYLSVGNPPGIVGWVGFSVGDPSETGSAGLSVLGFQQGTFQILNSNSLVGTIHVGTSMANNKYNLIVDFDEGAQTVQLTFSNAVTNVTSQTFSTVGAWTNSSRFVQLKHKTFAASTPGIVDYYVDNLMIESNYVQPPLVIGDVTLDLLAGTNALTLTWGTDIDRDYAVEAKLDLQASWTTNQTGISGTGGDVTVTDVVDQAQSFYRVVGE